MEAGKVDVVKLLQEAITVLNSLNIDNQQIKLIIASATTAINSAVTLTLAIKGGN